MSRYIIDGNQKVDNIINIDDMKPHIMIQNIDNNVHVLPESVLQDIDGKTRISDINRGNLIIRAIVADWLAIKKIKGEQNNGS